MRRKIFICFFVVLLMTTMVVPAFATSSGGSTGVAGPSVNIDYFRLVGSNGSGPVGDWPNNFSANGSSPVVGYFSDVASFECCYTSDLFETTIYPSSSGSLELSIDDIFLTANTVFTLDDDGIGGFVITNVSVTGFLVTISSSPNDPVYSTARHLFSGSYSVNAAEVDLAAILTLYCGASSGTGAITYLSDVKITIDYYSSDPDVDLGLHFTVNKAEFAQPFLSWFGQWNLSCSEVVVEAPGMFDWLLDSVNGFLDFELAPGFSLNSLFRIVLVLGVLIAFFKLFS